MRRRGPCVLLATLFLLAVVTSGAASNTDDYNEPNNDVAQPDEENLCAICLESLFEEKQVTPRHYFQCNTNQYHQECVDKKEAFQSLQNLKDPVDAQLMMALEMSFRPLEHYKLRSLLRSSLVERFEARVQLFQIIRKVEFVVRGRVFKLANDPESFESLQGLLEHQLTITKKHEEAIKAAGLIFQEEYLNNIFGGRKKYPSRKKYEPVVDSGSIEKVVEVFNSGGLYMDDRRQKPQAFLSAVNKNY